MSTKKTKAPPHFSTLSKEELRAISSKGGKASGIARRKYRSFREVGMHIMNLPIGTLPLGKKLDALLTSAFAGELERGEVTIAEVLIMAQILKGLKSDTAAFNAIVRAVEPVQAAVQIEAKGESALDLIAQQLVQTEPDTFDISDFLEAGEGVEQ